MLDEIIGFRPLAPGRLVSSRSIHASLISGRYPQADLVGRWAQGSRSVRSSASNRPTIEYEMRSCEKECRAPAIDRVFRDLESSSRPNSDRARIGLDVNIVIAGPGTTPKYGHRRRRANGSFCLDRRRRTWHSIDLNLHPYYPSSRGKARFPDHPRCSLVTTVQAASKIADLVQSMAIEASIFLGWNDEGHDHDRKGRQSEIEQTRAALERFNQSNDPRGLEELAVALASRSPRAVC